MSEALSFEPGFGSTIGDWRSPEWAQYREETERLLDDPAVVGAAGGELRVPWVRDNGDWTRVEADPELLQGIVAAYGPARWGGPLMRSDEAEVRLLRALSIVGGWDLVWIWARLLSQLELELGHARARDAESEEKTGRRGKTMRAVRDAGITWTGVWQDALQTWWTASGRPGEWQVGLNPTSVLTWAEIPEEATVGPCVVRWLDPALGEWNYSAMVNGVLRDRDTRAYRGLTFFFHTLSMT